MSPYPTKKIDKDNDNDGSELVTLFIKKPPDLNPVN